MRAQFYIFFGRRFSYAFLNFRHQNGSQKAPQVDTKSEEKSKMCSPVQLMFRKPFWHHFGCILAAIWEILGIFWSPFAVDVGNSGSHLGHLLATIDSHVASSDLTHWIPLLVIRATSGKSINEWRRTNHMDCWMDGLLVLTLLKPRGAGWVPARLAIHHFSDFVWHGVSWPFWYGFGIDFEAILEHLHIILAPKTAPSISYVFS